MDDDAYSQKLFNLIFHLTRKKSIFCGDQEQAGLNKQLIIK